MYIFAAGTTTPQTTYSDSTLMTPNTNPIVLNASGRAPAIYWNGTAIKMTLANKSLGACPGSPGTVIWSQDNVYDSATALRTALAAASGASMVGFQQVNGTATTVQAVLRNCPFDVQYPNLATATANIPAYGCLNVMGAGSGPITISASNVTLNCSPGSSIKAATNANAVTITGNNVTLDGCTIDGNETANPTWVKTGISATGVANLKLLNVTVMNSQNDTGISIQNAANFEVINPNVTAGIAALIINSTPSGTGNTSGTVRGGVLSKIVGAVPVAAQDVLVAFTSGASGLNQTINGLVIDDVTMNNGGSSWCLENNAITGSGTKIYSENVVLQNSRCYNTYGAAQRGIASFAGSNHARAVNNLYDGGGYAATITMEFASGDDQHAVHNTIRNMGAAPTFSISKDSVGKDFQALNNNLVGTLAVYIDDASVIPGFGASIVNPIIEGNAITIPSGAGVAISFETNGSASPANSITGGIIRGNQLTGNGSANSWPIGLVNFASDGGVIDNTLVAGNHSVSFPYGFGSGSNQTNTILSANRWEGATNECSGAACDGVISATDIGFPWVLATPLKATDIVGATISVGSNPVLTIAPASGVNSDTSGFHVLDGTGTYAYTWLSGPYTTATPNCTVSYYNHSGTLQTQFVETSTTLTLKGDAGANVSWMCAAKKP